MGRPLQKRIIRKLDLERVLSVIEPHPSPRPSLEQYTISVKAASAMLYLAAYENNDIVGKKVLDLGCGTGRLSLGSAFLGAESVVGIDVDLDSVKAAFHNSSKLNLGEKVQWVATNLDGIQGKFETVIQNPPYGVQKRGADLQFLRKALETGETIYSIHKSSGGDSNLVKRLKNIPNGIIAVSPSPFLEKFISRHGGKTRTVYAMIMTIPHMFEFHVRTRHEFVVDLYVIDSIKSTSRS